jgi:hypothetical protein
VATIANRTNAMVVKSTLLPKPAAKVATEISEIVGTKTRILHLDPRMIPIAAAKSIIVNIGSPPS